VSRLLALAGVLLAGSGVVLGAFGAHALKASLPPARLESWETAVLYQLLHGLTLLVLGSMGSQALPAATLRLAGSAFVVGTVLFSGSIYLLVLTELPLFGPVTPLGGIAMIGGWLTLAVAYARGP
jgi:uncharacterized membrane protein YgdD (TMEM256/DUF423 family)